MRDLVGGLEPPSVALPESQGRDATVFARLASAADVGRAAAGAADMNELRALSSALGDLYKMYSMRLIAGESHYGDEFCAIAGAFLLIATRELAAMDAVGIDVIAADPVRKGGALKMRFGFALTTLSTLGSPFDASVSGVHARDVAAAMAPVAADLSALMLPEERAFARDLVRKLADAGAADGDIRALDAAFADDAPRHRLLTAFEAEHRSYQPTEPANVPSKVPMGVPTTVPRAKR